MKHLVAAVLLLLAAVPFAAQSPPSLEVSKLDAIEPLVTEAIGERKLPGAVVLVGRGDAVLYEKAIGHRAVVPDPEPMTLDTIFDLASLTKVVATTTSVMILIEEGKIRLTDRVSVYIPGFERYGKADITIRHLMTHVSGLRPDVDLGEMWSGSETAIGLAIEEVPASAPGERFVYSDINYFLLGDIVRRVSGAPLDRFAHDRIFAPLGMKDTMFLPPGGGAAADRADGKLHAARLALPGAGHVDAPRDRPRSDGAPDGGCRGARGPLQHGGGPGDLQPHAPRRRRVPRRPDPVAAGGGEDDDAGHVAGRAERPRPRMGHGFHVLVQPRRAAAGRIVRPHRVHRHVAVAGSGDGDVRRVPLEPGAPGRAGRRDAAARSCRHRRGVVDRRRPRRHPQPHVHGT